MTVHAPSFFRRNPLPHEGWLKPDGHFLPNTDAGGHASTLERHLGHRSYDKAHEEGWAHLGGDRNYLGAYHPKHFTADQIRTIRELAHIHGLKEVELDSGGRNRPLRLARAGSDVEGLSRALRENPQDGTLWGALSDAMEEAGDEHTAGAIRALLHYEAHLGVLPGSFRTHDNAGAWKANGGKHVGPLGVVVPVGEGSVRLPSTDVSKKIFDKLRELGPWNGETREEHDDPGKFDEKRKHLGHLAYVLKTFSRGPESREYLAGAKIEKTLEGGAVTRASNDRPSYEWAAGGVVGAHSGQGRNLHLGNHPTHLRFTDHAPGDPVRLARPTTVYQSLGRALSSANSPTSSPGSRRSSTSS
jgi:hypothetical protein